MRNDMLIIVMTASPRRPGEPRAAQGLRLSHPARLCEARGQPLGLVWQLVAQARDWGLSQSSSSQQRPETQPGERPLEPQRHLYMY